LGENEFDKAEKSILRIAKVNGVYLKSPIRFQSEVDLRKRKKTKNTYLQKPTTELTEESSLLMKES
jgi:hypothetical protein